MAPTAPERLVSASDLKRQRGWTEGLLVSLLGAPDALGPNPHGFRAPQRFFRVDRALEAERDGSFARRAAGLSEWQAWRREQPVRTYGADEVHRLEWLDDAGRIRLFLAPRVPRRRRTRATEPAPVAAAGLRFEVLTLF